MIGKIPVITGTTLVISLAIAAMLAITVSAQPPPLPPSNDVIVNAIPESQTGIPGDGVTYSVNLMNNGSVSDIIVVDSVTDVPAGWAVELKDAGVPQALPYSTPLIQSKTSYPLTLDVYIPVNAAVGAYSMSINVHSCANPNKDDNTTVTVVVLESPIPEQPQFFKDESSVQGKGYISIEKKVQDWNVAVDVEEQIKGFGEFSMNSREILNESANIKDPANPNYYNQKLINFQGNNTNRLTSFTKYESPTFYGGTGAKVNTFFNVSELQKQESNKIKTISVPGGQQSLDFETMDVFSGTWSTYSEWIKTCKKELRHFQKYQGNFSVNKELKFEQEAIMP